MQIRSVTVGRDAGVAGAGGAGLAGLACSSSKRLESRTHRITRAHTNGGVQQRTLLRRVLRRVLLKKREGVPELGTKPLQGSKGISGLLSRAISKNPPSRL